MSNKIPKLVLRKWFHNFTFFQSSEILLKKELNDSTGIKGGEGIADGLKEEEDAETMNRRMSCVWVGPTFLCISSDSLNESLDRST